MAFITALILLFFSRANICGPSYYNLCLRFVVLSFLIADPKSSKSVSVRNLLSGISLSLAVLCNPYLSLPIIVIYPVLLTKKQNRKQLLQTGLGILISAGLYSVLFLFKGDIFQYANNLKYVLSDPAHATSFLSSLREMIDHHRNTNSMPVICAVALLCAYVLLKRKEKPSVLFYFLQITVCLLSLLKPLLLISVIPCYSYLGSFAISLFPSILWAVLQKDRSDAVILYLAGLLVAVCFAFASNTRYDAMLVGYCLSACAGFLYLSQQITSLPQKEKGSVCFRAVCILIGTFLVTISGVQRILGIYRDAPLSQLTVPLTDGPAAGLLTSKQQANQYNEILQVLKNDDLFTDDDACILNSKCVPWAYLCRHNRVGAPTTWAIPVSDPREESYLRQKNITDLYVCVYSSEVASYQSCYFNNHKETTTYNAQVFEGPLSGLLTDSNKIYSGRYITVYHL